MWVFDEVETFDDGIQKIRGLKVQHESMYRGGSSIRYKGLLFEYDYLLQVYRDCIPDEIREGVIDPTDPQFIKECIDDTVEHFKALGYKPNHKKRIELQNC